MKKLYNRKTSLMQSISLVLPRLLLLALLLVSLLILPIQLRTDDTLHLNYARNYVGYKEIGFNRGAFIDSCNRYVGNQYGSAYCSAFVSFMLYKANYSSPRKNPLANRMTNNSTYTALAVLQGHRQVKKGDLVIWQRGNTMFGHIGIAERDWKGTKGMTIQGNTSGNIENYDGDGIFQKVAKINPLNIKFRIVKFTKVAK